MSGWDTAPVGVESNSDHPTDHFPEHSPEEELPSFVSLYETPDEDICEFGDVVLVADDGFHPQLKIRVSSCVMACFSKVFRTLFSSRFAEGQSLRGGVSEIKLADNPTSLLVLCHYLHRQDHLSGKLASSNALLDYALIVDKYDCVNALKPEHDTLLDFLHKSEAWDAGHKRASLLAAAYILNLPDHFRRQTQALVREETLSIFALGDRCEDIVPAKVLASLKAQQDFIQRDLTLSLSNIIDQLSTAAYMSQKTTFGHTFLQNLKSHGLWPLDFRYAQLDSIAANLRLVHVPVLRADEEQPYQHPRYGHRRSISNESSGWGNPNSRPADHRWGDKARSPSPVERPDPLKGLSIPGHKDLLELADRIEKLCVGICLGCLKGDEGSGCCRVAHSVPQTSLTYVRDPYPCFYCNGLPQWDCDECSRPIVPPGWESLW